MLTPLLVHLGRARLDIIKAVGGVGQLAECTKNLRPTSNRFAAALSRSTPCTVVMPALFFARLAPAPPGRALETAKSPNTWPGFLAPSLVVPAPRPATVWFLVEHRKCNAHHCPVDCRVFGYGPWSDCSKTCGTGTGKSQQVASKWRQPAESRFLLRQQQWPKNAQHGRKSCARLESRIFLRIERPQKI